MRDEETNRHRRQPAEPSAGRPHRPCLSAVVSTQAGVVGAGDSVPRMEGLVISHQCQVKYLHISLEMGSGVSVVFSPDGDAWVTTDPRGCRFRTYAGGGTSLRVRNALLMLAMAIKLDNEKHLWPTLTVRV